MKLFKRRYLFFLLLITLQTACINNFPRQFDSYRAYENIKTQLSFGPRYPGSEGHKKEIEWIKNSLIKYKWKIEEQVFLYEGVQLINIIAFKGENKPSIILGTHFDTRKYSDNEVYAENKYIPVAGANDGASGVAVMLELARILEDKNDFQLVFFDAEDQGNISGWPWSIGAKHFVNELTVLPKKVAILDMVADIDQQFYIEMYSDKTVTSEIWTKGHQLNYSNVFISEEKYAIIDDHRPFIEAGIPTTLIIDFDYPFWHTTKDQINAISKDSLYVVGSVIYAWLMSNT